MSQLTASTIAAGSGDSGATVFTNHEANIILVQKCFYDTADPTSPVNGQHWVRSDEQKKYVYTSGAKTEVLWLYKLNQDLDCQSNNLNNYVIESLATGSLPTPAAGTKGRWTFDTTLSLPVYTTATANFYAAGWNVDATSMIAIPCSLNVSQAAQAATADTTTRGGGWLMDHTDDELNFVADAPVPSGWTGANDLYLEVCCSLSAAETAADDIDMDCEWLSLTPGSGDGWDKTKTAATTANYDIGAAASQYDMHKFRITIVYNDATNPVAAGDYISGYIERNTVGGAGKVASIVVHSVTLIVPCFKGTWA